MVSLKRRWRVTFGMKNKHFSNCPKHFFTIPILYAIMHRVVSR